MQDFVRGECSTNKRVDNHIVGGAAEAAFVGPCRIRDNRRPCNSRSSAILLLNKSGEKEQGATIRESCAVPCNMVGLSFPEAVNVIRVLLDRDICRVLPRVVLRKHGKDAALCGADPVSEIGDRSVRCLNDLGHINDLPT